MEIIIGSIWLLCLLILLLNCNKKSGLPKYNNPSPPKKICVGIVYGRRINR